MYFPGIREFGKSRVNPEKKGVIVRVFEKSIGLSSEFQVYSVRLHKMCGLHCCVRRSNKFGVKRHLLMHVALKTNVHESDENVGAVGRVDLPQSTATFPAAGTVRVVVEFRGTRQKNTHRWLLAVRHC